MDRIATTDRPAGSDRTSRTVRLADGRRIGYAEYGDPQGASVLAIHGTPGSRFMFALTDKAARERGLRIFAPERPGYGLSDFRRKDVLVQAAGDFADVRRCCRLAALRPDRRLGRRSLRGRRRRIDGRARRAAGAHQPGRTDRRVPEQDPHVEAAPVHLHQDRPLASVRRRVLLVAASRRALCAEPRLSRTDAEGGARGSKRAAQRRGESQSPGSVARRIAARASPGRVRICACSARLGA